MENNTNKQATTFYSSKQNVSLIGLGIIIIVGLILYRKMSQNFKSIFLLIILLISGLYYIIEIVKSKKNTQYITLDNDSLIVKNCDKFNSQNNDLEMTKYEDIDYVKLSPLNFSESRKYVAVYGYWYQGTHLDKQKNIFIYKKNGSIIECPEIDNREGLVTILKSKGVKVRFGNC